MNEGEIKGVARQALNMMKREIEQGRFRFFLGVYHEDSGGLRRLRKIEKFIDERMGEDWLDIDAKKDVAFEMMRHAVKFMTGVRRLRPDAVIFGAAANMFEATPQFWELPKERQEEIADGDSDRRSRAVVEGHLILHDAFTCWVHTPTCICVCAQERGDPEIKTELWDPKETDGRQKFFTEEAS